jgi:predicted DNA-binding protein
MSRRRIPKRKPKEKREHNPHHAVTTAHIPRDINDRLNEEAASTGLTKAAYLGHLISTQDNSVNLPELLVAALDRLAARQQTTRARVASLLLQRALREIGELG